MTNGLRTRCSRWLLGGVCSAALLLLTACGGGGGGGAGFLPDEGAIAIRYTLDLDLVDESGNATSFVSPTFPGKLLVTVREEVPPGQDEPPVGNVVVSAAADFAAVGPENGQALTDTNGVAEFQIQVGDVLGADTVTVTVESPAGTVTETINFQLIAAGLTLGFFDGTDFVPGKLGVSAESLPYRGSTIVQAALIDERGNPPGSIEQIRFTSDCSLSGFAGFSAIASETTPSASLSVDVVDGLASVEYQSGRCEMQDTLRAALVGGTTTATVDIDIADRGDSYIGFVRSTPSEGDGGGDRTIIALRGTGSPNRPEVATVIFEVLDAAPDADSGERLPLSGVPVSFSLTNSVGGISLLTDSSVTDANGLVEAEVQAGNVAASTYVVATVGNSGLSQQATSNQIVVSTGIPDQNSFSLSTSVFHVPTAANIDGEVVTLTIRMADRFNNPVPDGTTAVFTTEYGAVDASCETGTANGTIYQQLVDSTEPIRGACSVAWISQAPRFPLIGLDSIQTTDDGDYDCPFHTGSFGPCPADIGAIRGLRSTVLVTAVGEESFIDSNGNGLYDAGESFGNLPEAFLDLNEDGVHTPSQGPACPSPSTTENCEIGGSQEEFIDFNRDGMYSLNVDPNTGEGVYNGTLCPPEGDGVYCSRELLNVRASTVLTLSSAARNQEVVGARSSDGRFTSTGLNERTVYDIYVADVFNNAPGAGTVITFSTTGDCQLIFPEETEEYSETVPDLITRYGAYTAQVAINGTGGSGTLQVAASDPDSDTATTLLSFRCVTQCEPLDEGYTPIDPANPPAGVPSPLPPGICE